MISDNANYFLWTELLSAPSPDQSVNCGVGKYILLSGNSNNNLS